MNERLTWIPLSYRKNINQVRVVVEPFDNQIYGGYYALGSKTLVVVEKPTWSDNKCLASTIAHEYRHHIQYELSLYKSLRSIIRTDIDYESSISDYFCRYPHELDALLFEHKYSNTELNTWWLKHLVYPNLKLKT